MSLPPGTSWLGSHLELFHTSVNFVVYSRSGENGACAVPPGVSGLAHASWVLALLPTVLLVDSPVEASTSHGRREARLSHGPVGSVQPAPLTKQPTTEFLGVCDAPKRGVGLASK